MSVATTTAPVRASSAPRPRGRAGEGRGEAQGQGVAAVVEDLQHGDRACGGGHVAAQLVAGAGGEAVGDLLAVADDGPGDVPAAAERVVAPGEQHAPLRVVHQQVDVGRGGDLGDEAEQRRRQEGAGAGQAGQDGL